jgi:hypothetical protein
MLLDPRLDLLDRRLELLALARILEVADDLTRL